MQHSLPTLLKCNRPQHSLPKLGLFPEVSVYSVEQPHSSAAATPARVTSAVRAETNLMRRLTTNLAAACHLLYNSTPQLQSTSRNPVDKSVGKILSRIRKIHASVTQNLTPVATATASSAVPAPVKFADQRWHHSSFSIRPIAQSLDTIAFDGFPTAI